MLWGPDSYKLIDLAPCNPAGGGFAKSDLAGGNNPDQALLDTTSIVWGALASGPVSHDAISLHAVRGDLSFAVALRGSPPGALTPAERPRFASPGSPLDPRPPESGAWTAADRFPAR